jgi:hypothetical protein
MLSFFFCVAGPWPASVVCHKGETRAFVASVAQRGEVDETIGIKDGEGTGT